MAIFGGVTLVYDGVFVLVCVCVGVFNAYFQKLTE